MVIKYKKNGMLKLFKKHNKDIMYVVKDHFQNYEYYYYKVFHIEKFGYSVYYMINRIIRYYKFNTDGTYLYDNDIPSVIKYNNKGYIIEEFFMKNDKIYRLDKPSIIKYNNKKIIEEQYIVNDVYYRKNRFLPVCIEYDNEGNVISSNFISDNTVINFIKVVNDI